jgi:excisionase family DNA binding protein
MEKRVENLLDMNTASKYLNIKMSSLYQLVMRRKLTVVKIGRLNRFRKIDLDSYISKNVKKAESLLV